MPTNTQDTEAERERLARRLLDVSVLIEMRRYGSLSMQDAEDLADAASALRRTEGTEPVGMREFEGLVLAEASAAMNVEHDEFSRDAHIARAYADGLHFALDAYRRALGSGGGELPGDRIPSSRQNSEAVEEAARLAESMGAPEAASEIRSLKVRRALAVQPDQEERT